MKVLFFSHQADFIYGGEVCTLAFMEELGRRGVEVHFASPPGPYQERAKRVAICHEVPSVQFSRKLFALPTLVPALLATSRKLAKIMDAHGIPLLHATSLKAMAYAWRLGKSRAVVWHHHDILPPAWANDLWVRFLAGRAALVLAPSSATRDSLLRAGVGGSKCKVLPNGFRLEQWASRPGRSPGAPFRIGLIGELSPRKGVDRLPGILQALRGQGGLAGCEFVLVGEGLSDPAFAAEMRRALQKEPVCFLGRREDVPQILQGLDLLLVPSRQDPLPTVVVEAFLSGVPVVGSPVGGIPEMVLPGENGYLATSDEEFAAAILHCRELAEWERLHQGARESAERGYDLEKITESLLGYYRTIHAV